MAEKSIFAPKDLENPWRIEDGKTVEEWFEFALWYPYSIRTLLADGCWQEVARCNTLEKASQVMKGLVKLHQQDFGYYILIQCLRVGTEGREKLIEYAPSKRQVHAAVENICVSQWE